MHSKLIELDETTYNYIKEYHVDELCLSNKEKKCLLDAGLFTVELLLDKSKDELKSLPNMTNDYLEDIINNIQKFNKNKSDIITKNIEHTDYTKITLLNKEDAEVPNDVSLSPDDFSHIVKDKLFNMFVAKEKNRMSFYDIWEGLGKTVSRPTVEIELEKLVEEGILSVAENEYHYEFVSILDAIEKLPTKYRNILMMKLQGLKYDEIANRYGVTKSKIQQLAAKGMTAVIRGTKSIPPVGRVKEDDDRELFQTYNISIGEWVSDLKKPEYAYRYLAMRYKKGDARLPGAKKKMICWSHHKVPAKAITTESRNINNFLKYYKSLAGVQRDVVLYSNEEQYTNDLKRLSEKINCEIKCSKNISEIIITDNEYIMLRDYLHYAVKLLNNADTTIDAALFVTAITKVVERVYDGNLWGTFFKEIGVKQTHYAQTNIGRMYCSILGLFKLDKDEDERFLKSVLMHCS